MQFSIDDVITKKTINLNVEGWKPLVIDYGLVQISKQSYLLWQIKNSDHLFNIPLSIVLQHHKGNYKEHFELALKKFREDLLVWIDDGLPEDYMKNYYKEFYGLLEI